MSYILLHRTLKANQNNLLLYSTNISETSERETQNLIKFRHANLTLMDRIIHIRILHTKTNQFVCCRSLPRISNGIHLKPNFAESVNVIIGRHQEYRGETSFITLHRSSISNRIRSQDGAFIILKRDKLISKSVKMPVYHTGSPESSAIAIGPFVRLE